jgi:HPt (histidine-containing phosphotransfer) domain-containing protein
MLLPLGKKYLKIFCMEAIKFVPMNKKIQDKLNFINGFPDVEVATIEMLLMHSQGDKTIIHEIYNSFYPDAEQLIEEMNQAVLTMQYDSLRKAAHSLSGVSGSVGALKLKEASRVVENALKRNDTETALALAGEMRSIYQAFLTSLKTYL